MTMKTFVVVLSRKLGCSSTSVGLIHHLVDSKEDVFGVKIKYKFDERIFLSFCSILCFSDLIKEIGLVLQNVLPLDLSGYSPVVVF